MQPRNEIALGLQIDQISADVRPAAIGDAAPAVPRHRRRPPLRGVSVNRRLAVEVTAEPVAGIDMRDPIGPYLKQLELRRRFPQVVAPGEGDVVMRLRVCPSA